MLLREIAQCSGNISATRSRKRKAGLVAECLQRAGSDAGLAAQYLCGELPQGRIGVSTALLSKTALPPACEHSSLTLRAVDQVMTDIGAAKGAGSQGQRERLLGGLLAQAPTDERQFLVRLLSGDLGQGALEGVMVEAIAVASSVARTRVRRAVMYAGDIGAVANAAVARGGAGLDEFSMTVFRPVVPMLAQPADDLESAEIFRACAAD